MVSWDSLKKYLIILFNTPITLFAIRPDRITNNEVLNRMETNRNYIMIKIKERKLFLKNLRTLITIIVFLDLLDSYSTITRWCPSSELLWPTIFLAWCFAEDILTSNCVSVTFYLSSIDMLLVSLSLSKLLNTLVLWTLANHNTWSNLLWSWMLHLIFQRDFIAKIFVNTYSQIGIFFNSGENSSNNIQLQLTNNSFFIFVSH